MRRDMFLKSLAALAAAGTLPLSALAAANIKMMIPANPGGGWDTTGRALGKALVDAAPESTKALPSARPVVSHPPPGLAGIIILILAAASADKGKEPAAANAARDFRNMSRRMGSLL